jgi:hypothetical protein
MNKDKETIHRNSKSLDSIAEIYTSTDIHNLIHKYSNPTTKKERKNYKSLLKRIVDYHITQLLNPLTTETVTQLFWFLKEYFEKGGLFSYSSINLIFQNFLDNKKDFQLLYLDCDIVLDIEVPNLGSTTTTDTTEQTTSTVQVRQSIQVVKYILDLLLTKSTYSNITCNQKFTKLITEFFHWHLTTYFNNKVLFQLSKEGEEFILSQFNTGLQLLVESNIYLDDIYLTQLCEIYDLIYIHHLDNNNDLVFGIITTLFKYINSFILSNDQYKTLSRHNTSYCNKQRCIEYDGLYIPYQCSLKISHLKDKLFAKLHSNQKATKQSNGKKTHHTHLPKVWTSTIHKAISCRFLGDTSGHNSVKISNIVDGRNTYYDNYKSDAEHKLNLAKFENDVVKWIFLDDDDKSITSRQGTVVIFNCRHYNIIKKSLARILSRLINDDVDCNDNIDCDNKCNVDKKNNYKVRTIKNHLDKNNQSRHISITGYNGNSCVIVFTPRGVDDDLMSIYLKLTYPTASIKTSDTYGKYGELIHNNHYYYTLWCKVFNL